MIKYKGFAKIDMRYYLRIKMMPFIQIAICFFIAQSCFLKTILLRTLNS